MKLCKGCGKDELSTQFNGDYSYCQACYAKYKRRQKNKKSRPTCVYFIRSGDLIKIGFTGDLNERVNNIKVNNPAEVKVLKTITGGYNEEQKLHKQFAHLNKTGEWFYATDELIDFINNL